MAAVDIAADSVSLAPLVMDHDDLPDGSVSPVPASIAGTLAGPVRDSASLGIVVTDDRQLIRYSNKAFLKSTGYTLRELIGKNCKILQGSGTDQSTVSTIRKALTSCASVHVQLLNYRKDGTPFWNFLQITPVLDSAGKVVRYLGLQYFVDIAYVDKPMSVFPWISPDSLQFQKKLGIVTYRKKKPKTSESKYHLLKSSSPTSSPTSESSTPTTDSSSASFDKFEIDEKEFWDEESSTSSIKEVESEPRYSFIAETLLPTRRGKFRVRAYREAGTHYEPVALIVGDVSGLEDVPVRVHDQCFTSEVLGSLKCDCREQLEYAMDYIQAKSPGIVIYLQQEGRGMGLANKVKAYSLQEHGFDTVDANKVLGFEDDTREYSAVSYILSELGVKSIKLLTNNPRKIEELSALGITITGRIPVELDSNPFSAGYLKAKTFRMGHMFSLDEAESSPLVCKHS